MEPHIQPGTGRQEGPLQWVLTDLIFLRGARVAIDADTFASVLEYENRHYNFAPCECGAKSLGQHLMDCRSASILWEPDWYRRIVEEDWPVKRTQ